MVQVSIELKCSCGYAKKIKGDTGLLGELHISSDETEKCPQCGKKL